MPSFDEKTARSVREAQRERFFPTYTPTWNPVVHLLIDLGVGTNFIAKTVGLPSSNVARWKRSRSDDGRPIPSKHLPALYEMLREAVRVGEELLSGYERQESLKPSIVNEVGNIAMIRYNRTAQIAEFKRTLALAKEELGD